MSKVKDVLNSLPGRHHNNPWARLHRVVPNPGGWFDVTSARSGETYRVMPLGGDRARCTCEAGQHDQPCSHVVAVREYAIGVMVDAARGRR